MEIVKRKGFTLIEALAASAILALVVVSAGAISNHSVKRTVNNMKYQQAWAIMDRQMTFLAWQGVEKFIASGQTSGTIEPEENSGDITYFWQVEVNEEEPDSLYLITITVGWDNKTIKAQTVLNKGQANAQ